MYSELGWRSLGGCVWLSALWSSMPASSEERYELHIPILFSLSCSPRPTSCRFAHLFLRFCFVIDKKLQFCRLVCLLCFSDFGICCICLTLISQCQHRIQVFLCFCDLFLRLTSIFFTSPAAGSKVVRAFFRLDISSQGPFCWFASSRYAGCAFSPLVEHGCVKLIWIFCGTK